MKKNMKIITVILAVVMIASIAIVAKKYISRPEYTLEEIISLINPKISDNMYLKIENHTQLLDDSIIPNSTVETYINNNKVYEKFSSPDEVFSESFFDFKNKEQKTILHYNKEINYFNLDYLNSPTEIIASSLDFYKNNLLDRKDTYEYYGKEILDGKQCIKISVIFEEDYFVGISEKTKSYYYIDEENKCIIREESYLANEEELEPVSTATFTYIYDTISIEDVKEFDASNYLGYTINDSEISNNIITDE